MGEKILKNAIYTKKLKHFGSFKIYKLNYQSNFHFSPTMTNKNMLLFLYYTILKIRFKRKPKPLILKIIFYN